MTIDLATFQQEMAAILFNPAAAETGWLESQLLSCSDDADDKRQQQLAERLAIYRNNVMYSLTQAMKAQFPIVERVIGEPFFQALARDYILANPPTSPSLTFIGSSFPAFISQHQHCQPLPYLADLARLEWLCQKALHSADDPVLQPADLACLAPDFLPGARLSLHDSASLFHSPFPITRIWEENLKGNPDPVNLKQEKPAWALIYRKLDRVNVITMESHVFNLLRFLQQGISIEESWEQVIALDAVDENDLSSIFAWLLDLAVFSQISIRH